MSTDPPASSRAFRKPNLSPDIILEDKTAKNGPPPAQPSSPSLPSSPTPPSAPEGEITTSSIPNKKFLPRVSWDEGGIPQKYSSKPGTASEAKSKVPSAPSPSPPEGSTSGASTTKAKEKTMRQPRASRDDSDLLRLQNLQTKKSKFGFSFEKFHRRLFSHDSEKKKKKEDIE